MKKRKLRGSVPPPDERIRIVMSYIESDMSANQAAEYNGVCPRTFAKWVKEYKEICRNEKKVVPLQAKVETPKQAMDYATPQDEITALKAQLEKEQKDRICAENKVTALNRMIDIAEAQGILIRKNSGAKQ